MFISARAVADRGSARRSSTWACWPGSLLGKGELGQMTVFDLVLILLIANAVQTRHGRPGRFPPGGAGPPAFCSCSTGGCRSSASPLRCSAGSSRPTTVVIQPGRPLVGPMRRQRPLEEDLRDGRAGARDRRRLLRRAGRAGDDGSISIVPSSSKTYHRGRPPTRRCAGGIGSRSHERTKRSDVTGDEPAESSDRGTGRKRANDSGAHCGGALGLAGAAGAESRRVPGATRARVGGSTGRAGGARRRPSSD